MNTIRHKGSPYGAAAINVMSIDDFLLVGQNGLLYAGSCNYNLSECSIGYKFTRVEM